MDKPTDKGYVVTIIAIKGCLLGGNTLHTSIPFPTLESAFEWTKTMLYANMTAARRVRLVSIIYEEHQVL